MSFQGRKNTYTCEKCGESIITIDRDDGTTPYGIKCKICEQGMAFSNFYRPTSGTPTWEWYRPHKFDVGKNPINIDHWKKGGLFLRKIQPQEIKDAKVQEEAHRYRSISTDNGNKVG